MENKKIILITGVAGFIGFHLAKQLAGTYYVIGIDNLDDYYDLDLKKNRLNELGIELDDVDIFSKSSSLSIKFYKIDLKSKIQISDLFKTHNFHCVIHLAAQAGVRYSLINPDTYVQNNINAFFNLLDVIKTFSVRNLIYASSSSVYGSNEKVPFEEDDRTDNQVSLYAATKKINEVLASTYSKIYDINCVGLRFFTVYGPYGRPDMAYYKFSNLLSENKPVELYNHGNQIRDYTHVNDIVKGIQLVVDHIGIKKLKPIYNIGSGVPIELDFLIKSLEDNFEKKFQINKVKHQLGDVKRTLASTKSIHQDLGFSIKSNFKEGLIQFVKWYKEYYGN